MNLAIENVTPLVYYEYEHIALLPNFGPAIDISKHKIEGLIAEYHFKDSHHCGKKGCNQPNSNGWVAVTHDGLVTIIGSICGLEWGGETFNSHVSQLSKLIKRDSKLKAFNEVKDKANEILDKVNQLKTRLRGANWLDATISRFKENCSQQLFHELKYRALKNETSVMKETLKTQQEMDLDDVSNTSKKRSQYKTEFIGNLVGIDVFNHDLRTILMDKIYSTVKRLQNIEPSSLPTPKLSSLLKETEGFEVLFRQAEDILEKGQLFFSTDNNFKLLKHLDKKYEVRSNDLTRINWYNK